MKSDQYCNPPSTSLIVKELSFIMHIHKVWKQFQKKEDGFMDHSQVYQTFQYVLGLVLKPASEIQL